MFGPNPNRVAADIREMENLTSWRFMRILGEMVEEFWRNWNWLICEKILKELPSIGERQRKMRFLGHYGIWGQICPPIWKLLQCCPAMFVWPFLDQMIEKERRTFASTRVVGFAATKNEGRKEGGRKESGSGTGQMREDKTRSQAPIVILGLDIHHDEARL